MYLAVKQWVFERGGRLMYLGGMDSIARSYSRGWIDAMPFSPS